MAMDPILCEAFERLLADASPPQAVREIEAGESPDALWHQILESGFADAMVPEDQAGGGIGLGDACALFFLCGRQALPLPLAQTMVVRSLCAANGIALPEGPIAIAPWPLADTGDAIECRNVPFGRIAHSVLVPDAASSEQPGVLLLPVSKAKCNDTGVHGSLRAHMSWKNTASGVALGTRLPWLDFAAAITAAQMAGAMDAVLQMTVRYAGERSQFGRPIGKFQAIQQQLSVLAELASASRVGAELGCRATASGAPNAIAVAVAKARASEAAGTVVSIAHGVHAAMGITSEYDLQLHTRRLLEWRSDYGSAAYWQRRVGDAVLSSDAASTLEFMLPALFDNPTGK